jgi:hypothetical protein
LIKPKVASALILALLAARASAARAGDDDAPVDARHPRAAAPADDVSPVDGPALRVPESPTRRYLDDASPDDSDSVLSTFYPPPVDGPALRLPESPTRLYFDGAFAQSKDLSALQVIAGSGYNFRFALGGAWRHHHVTYEAEIPFLQITTINVTEVPGGGPPAPEDAHQTGYSFGDVRIGAIWTVPLAGEALVGGFGLRTRLATHSTRFQFHLSTDNSLVTESFPYYFHIEPTAVLGGALGRFTFVVNEGMLVLAGPNGVVEGQEVVVPTIVFWDSHVAIGYAPFDFLGASVELGTDIQVNSVDDPQFVVKDVRSAWVAPAVQLHFGDLRVDLIARLGLTNGATFFGVLDYIGTNSYTLRVSRAFN